MAKRILVVNGPNLNMLGRREPSIYGAMDLAGIDELCRTEGQRLGLAVDCRQSNHEGELIEFIHQAADDHDGLVLNAGAYTHTSVALHDAVRAAGLPTIEVHLSNIHGRESFRHQSYISPIATGVICGLGPRGYVYALGALAELLAAAD
jgi:3-dehydroquinate dehydratase-2